MFNIWISCWIYFFSCLFIIKIRDLQINLTHDSEKVCEVGDNPSVIFGATSIVALISLTEHAHFQLSPLSDNFTIAHPVHKGESSASGIHITEEFYLPVFWRRVGGGLWHRYISKRHWKSKKKFQEWCFFFSMKIPKKDTSSFWCNIWETFFSSLILKKSFLYIHVFRYHSLCRCNMHAHTGTHLVYDLVGIKI